MHVAALILDSLALLFSVAGLSASAVLYGTWKSRALLLHMVFSASIAAFVVAMAMWDLSVPLGSRPGGPLTTEALALGATVLRTLGGTTLVAILPDYTYTISNGQPPAGTRWVFFILATLVGIGGAATICLPTPQWTTHVLTGILFGTIAFSVAIMFRKSRAGKRTAADFDTGAIARALVVMSLAFLPLFATDILVSSIPVPKLIAGLDGTSVPAFLIAVSVGSFVFAQRKLSAPPLYRDEHLTSHCRQKFSLTNRETEVVEYIMEGYSVPDLASVLKISPKTAENHLYRAYEKLSVSNRIQLFQTLMAHR